MSVLHFDHLVGRYKKQASSHPHLVHATVELTYGCNLRCVHCFNPTHYAKGERTTQEIFHTLDELVAEGCLWVGFTGGEIFTRRDSMEILWYAKKLGMVVSILTNATMITPVLADQIQALEPFLVEISVYGSNAETYEKVTGIRGSFQKFVTGMDLLIERRVTVLLKVVLMSINVHEFEEMWNFSTKRGVNCRVSTSIQPKADGSKEPLAYRIDPERVFEIWKKLSGETLRRKQLLAENVIREDIMEEGCNTSSEEPLFQCACGKSNAAITPYGKMNLCVSMHHPQINLNEVSVHEAWQSLVDLVAQARPGSGYECGTCPVEKRCDRGPKDGWLEEGKFDAGCLPYHQKIAQLKTEFLSVPSTTGTLNEEN